MVHGWAHLLDGERDSIETSVWSVGSLFVCIWDVWRIAHISEYDANVYAYLSGVQHPIDEL
jgi:hypothetical protein